MSSASANVPGFASAALEVEDWLKDLYGDKVEFNANDRNVEILKQIKRSIDTSSRNAAVILEDQKKRTTDYNAECERIHKIMEHVGVTSERISRETQMMVKSLALAGTSLHLQRPSTTSFLLALTEMSMETARVRTKKRSLDRMIAQAQLVYFNTYKKIQDLECSLQLINDHQKVEKKELQKLEGDREFLKTKICNYDYDISCLMETYKKSGMDESLTIQALQKKQQALEKLKEELAIANRKLKNYRDLPPNLELATEKLEELKVQLEKMDREMLPCSQNLQ